jgi:iron complex outermembrane receptor protein
MQQRLTIAVAGMVAILSTALAQESAPDAEAARQIEEVVVFGSQVALPGVYAGGQVARGARAGLLGNLDFLDAPFAATAYTAELVRDQQARSVGDVLQNDPTVRVAKGFGNFQELYMIRGFPVFSDDMTFNGVYGILPRQYLAAELIGRVEVFRGANAFLNGAAPGGSSVGGAFNVVPKRAPDQPLNRLTGGYENGEHLYAAADIARRFGTADAYGVRINGVFRDGEMAIDGQDRSLSVLSAGTDYRGERLRFSADLGWQDHRIDSPRPQVTPLGAVPDAPDASSNYAQPWTFTDETQLFGAVRGEFDLTPGTTVWLAAGARNGEEANVLANPNAAADGATTSFRFDNTREDDVFSADAGIRSAFSTGPVDHRLIVSASTISLESRNAFAFSDFAGFANDLYAPTAVAAPSADFFLGGDLTDPLKTEAVDNSSIAIADIAEFLDGRVLAVAGARWQRIDTASFDFSTGVEVSGYRDETVTPSFALVVRPSRALADRLSVYANYAESLQPGDIAPASTGTQPILNAGEVLAPFRGEQIEAGVKYDAGRFAGTFSLFSLSRPNAIVVDQVFRADGEQRNTGAELSVFGEPVAGVRLLGGMTWLDAELSRTQDGIDEGNRPIGVPEFQANVNVEWDVPRLRGLTVDARVIHTGEQFIDTANAVTLPAWTRFDLGLRYAASIGDRGLMLRARVENVADDGYWASTGGFPGANYLVQGAPRTFLLSASVTL